MAPSADPLRLQVLNRIVAVLLAIEAGASYWYKPIAVERKRFMTLEQCAGFPTLMVFPVSGGPIEHSGAPDGSTKTWRSSSRLTPRTSWIR